MAVMGINVGRKRVFLTAYCPDDALGVMAAEFVLARAAEMLDGTSDGELRNWWTTHDPGAADLFEHLDRGWQLPKGEPLTVDPTNALAETRIVAHILSEQRQMRGLPGPAPAARSH